MPSNILSDQLLDVRVRLRFEFYPQFFDPLYLELDPSLRIKECYLSQHGHSCSEIDM